MKGIFERLAAALLGSLLALGLLATAVAAEPGKSPRVAKPTVKIEKGDQCVEPTDEMRRDHMTMLLHQRDQTVRSGIRTTRHSLKACVDCHASPRTNSVLGKEGFCESCHAYAAVSIDCFECHASAPRKQAGSAGTVGAHSSLLEQRRPGAAVPGRQAAPALAQGGTR